MLKNFKYVLIFLCFGCSGAKVVYDYNPKADFAKYKSFLFFADAGKGLSQLDVKRFKRALESELDTLGIQASQTPNFYINIVVEKAFVDQSNVGFDFIGGGRNVGVGMSVGTTIGNKKVNETVTVEFVDAKSNMLFWQASTREIVRERMKPLERVAYVEKIVAKILDGFPPQ